MKRFENAKDGVFAFSILYHGIWHIFTEVLNGNVYWFCGGV